MPDQWLVSRAPTGTGDVRYRLPYPDTVKIGRSPTSSLVVSDPAVSRDHAILEWNAHDDGGGHWRVMDCASSSGTRVNGVKLRMFQSLRLRPGDRLDIGPVTLEYVERNAEVGSSTIHSKADDTACEVVQPVQPVALSAEQLEAVLEGSHHIHNAENEEAVYQCVVSTLVKCTGFNDAAFVRPSADCVDIKVLASAGKTATRSFSRTVLRRARTGPVIISNAQDQSMTMAGTLVGMEMSRVICVPVDLHEDFFGLLYLSDSARPNINVEVLASVAQSLARVAALALSNLLRTSMSQRLEAEQRAMFDGTLQALIATIDAKDPYTRGHSARVADYVCLLARAFGLPEHECERTRLCGLVHDIGKIGVSEAVLRKADQLTEEEFRHIAAHPVIGQEILRGIPQMADLLPGVLEHHERFDGHGYPNGTAGKAISQMGRLVCIADALDAMTTNRTYRPAKPLPDALAEVQRCAGSHFDPDMAKALASIDPRDLQRVMGAHVMAGAAVPLPPEHARPFTNLKVS